MDKALLLDAARQLDLDAAARQLDALSSKTSMYAFEQAVRQFNALLEQAKSLYPNRPDIMAVLP